MATSNLKFGMCRDIIANSNITKAFIIHPCDSCIPNAIHVVRMYVHIEHVSMRHIINIMTQDSNHLHYDTIF